MSQFRTIAKVGGISVGIAALAYLATYLIPATYAARFSLYFPNAAPSLPSLPTAPAQSGGSDPGSIKTLGGALVSPVVASGPQTAKGILASMTALREVVQKRDLAQRWGVTEGKAIELLRKSLEVEIDDSGFLKVEVSGESREFCTELLKDLQSHLNRRANQLSINVSRKNRQFIEERLTEAAEQAEQLENEVVELMSDPKVAELAGASSNYAEFVAKIEDARTSMILAEARLKAGEARLLELIDMSQEYPFRMLALQYVNDSLSSIAADILGRRLALERTMDRFTKTSSEFRDAKRDLDVIESFAEQLVNAEKSAIRSGDSPQLSQAKVEFATMKATFSRYEELRKQYEQRLGASARQDVDLSRAKRESEAALSRVTALKNELEIARIAEDRDPSRFEVVDEPMGLEEPVGPRRAMIAGVIFVLALLVQVWPHVRNRLALED